MLNLFWKSVLSGGLASIALLSLGSFVFKQSTDIGVAQETDAAQSIDAGQLADIAFEYALAQQLETATSLLNQAESYMEEGCFEGNDWLKIGVGYQTVGQSNKAESLLTQAFEVSRDHTSENCAGSRTSPNESLLNRAVEYAEAGHLDLAMTIAQGVDDWAQAWTLAQIAEQYGQAGQQQQAQQIFAQAMAIAKESNDPALHFSPLIPIGEMIRTGQQIDLAKIFIEQSGWSTPPSASEEAHSPEALLMLNDRRIWLARMLGDINEPQQALVLLDAVVPNIPPLSSEYPADTIQIWVDIARAYGDLGSDRQSNNAWEKARMSLQQISNAQSLAFAQATLVRAYADAGDFEQSSALAQAMENEMERQVAYGAIATAYAREGLVEDANDMLLLAGEAQWSTRSGMLHAYLETEQYEQVEKLANQPDMQDAWPEIGRVYCKSGRLEKAISVIDSIPFADWLRGCVSTAFAERSQFDRALELAQTIQDPSSRAGVLTDIAAQYNRTSEPDKAVEILDRALSLLQRRS